MERDTSSKSTKARKRAGPVALHLLHVVSDFEPVVRSLLKCPLLKGVFDFSRAELSVRCHSSVFFDPAFHHSEHKLIDPAALNYCIFLLFLQASLRRVLHAWPLTAFGSGDVARERGS
jgi:hypothetical protein